MGILKLLTEQYSCDICGNSSNKALMQVLVDGRICNDCFNKLGKGKFFTKYTIQDAKTKILETSLNTCFKTNSIPFPYRSKEEYDMDCRRDKYIYSAKYKKLSDLYYNDLTKINNLWSILYNLNEFNGQKASEYEVLCLNHINIFKKIYIEFCVPYNTVEFTCVPSYKRLAMLYEKQKRYKEATFVCLDAIEHGATNEYGDGGSGKMYARLARMAKKAGMLENQEVTNLLEKRDKVSNTKML